MTVKSLENIEFEKLIECFLLAFTNYYVDMPQSAEYYKKRWSHTKVDLKLSYGMFDGENLVGFIINGIDMRNGFLTAYNAGTGVLPDYRKRKIINKIYDHAIPLMKAKGIKKCLLEVITKNEIAIRSYKNIGFEISRTLKCFSGELDTIHFKDQLIEKPMTEIEFTTLPNQQYYSWDHHKNSIISNTDYKYYQIEKQAKPIAYFIINDSTGQLAQFDIFDNKLSHWGTLFSGIQRISKQLKINNIDNQLHNKINTLQSLALDNKIDQYEMVMYI